MFIANKSRSAKFFWRSADVACSLLVIFYVLFNVLDLDGSNACRIGNSGDYSPTVGEVAGDIRFDGSVEPTNSQRAMRRLMGRHANKLTRQHRADDSTFPLSIGGRSHGDRGCRSLNAAASTSPDH